MLCSSYICRSTLYPSGAHCCYVTLGWFSAALNFPSHVAQIITDSCLRVNVNGEESWVGLVVGGWRSPHRGGPLWPPWAGTGACPYNGSAFDGLRNERRDRPTSTASGPGLSRVGLNPHSPDPCSKDRLRSSPE